MISHFNKTEIWQNHEETPNERAIDQCYHSPTLRHISELFSWSCLRWTGKTCDTIWVNVSYVGVSVWFISFHLILPLLKQQNCFWTVGILCTQFALGALGGACLCVLYMVHNSENAWGGIMQYKHGLMALWLFSKGVENVKCLILPLPLMRHLYLFWLSAFCSLLFLCLWTTLFSLLTIAYLQKDKPYSNTKFLLISWNLKRYKPADWRMMNVFKLLASHMFFLLKSSFSTHLRTKRYLLGNLVCSFELIVIFSQSHTQHKSFWGHVKKIMHLIYSSSCDYLSTRLFDLLCQWTV